MYWRQHIVYNFALQLRDSHSHLPHFESYMLRIEGYIR